MRWRTEGRVPSICSVTKKTHQTIPDSVPNWTRDVWNRHVQKQKKLKKPETIIRAAGSLRVAGSKHSPLLPVITGMLRGRERQSKMMGFCTQGMRKWVPSPTTTSWTPRNRSKMTALCPASTRGGNSASGSGVKQPSEVLALFPPVQEEHRAAKIPTKNWKRSARPTHRCTGQN